MADDQTPPAEGDELILTPEQQVEEQAPAQEPVVEQAQDPIEELARDIGWTPKEDFTGKPEEWRDAATFIRASRDIQRDMGKQLKELRSTMDTMQRTSTTLLQQQLEDQKTRLVAEFNQAVEDGDSGQALKLGREIDQLETPKPNGSPPEARQFAERHSAWFNKDPLATARAVEITNILAKAGYSTAEQLEAAERAVRKEFPEHFPPAAKQQAATHQPQRIATQRTTKKGFADLPPDAQKMALDMEDRLSIPKETYAANYWAEQTKQQTPRRA